LAHLDPHPSGVCFKARFTPPINHLDQQSIGVQNNPLKISGVSRINDKCNRQRKNLNSRERKHDPGTLSRKHRRDATRNDTDRPKSDTALTWRQRTVPPK
jgi:hypothetical protein